MQREPRYSGPNRSGVCRCGHPWQQHHLSMILKQEIVELLKEGYVPGECLHYGNNELGGYMPAPEPNEEGEWIPHCFGYVDSKENLIEDSSEVPLLP